MATDTTAPDNALSLSPSTNSHKSLHRPPQGLFIRSRKAMGLAELTIGVRHCRPGSISEIQKKNQHRRLTETSSSSYLSFLAPKSSPATRTWCTLTLVC